MTITKPLRGLARRIYFAFLMAAVIPTALAGLIGIYVSLDTLRAETLRNLQQEVAVRAQGVGLFFDQLAAEILYLADAAPLEELRVALRTGDRQRIGAATTRLERDYTSLATTYPHLYQIRYMDAGGQEIVRVDKKDSQVTVIPAERLQNKADRYYFSDAIRRKPGELYVSPLDLNIEFGVVEQPERPVIRVATPIGTGSGPNDGMLVINLHADFLLEQIQQMVQARSGTAYLFDRAGHFLAHTASSKAKFSLQPIESLESRFGTEAIKDIFVTADGTSSVANDIFAHAAIRFGPTYPKEEAAPWVIAVAFPERTLFFSVFNLYALYAILGISLLATAIGGYALSRHLLKPLEALSRESEEIAAGNFSHRVEVRGSDEIAGLGEKFNAMAARIEQLVGSLAAHRDRLEDEVRARTAELEREQEERREVDRQMFQMDKMATMGELAMGMAHEIGNPLAGMKAVAQAVQFEEDLPPGIREALRRFEAEVDRLSDFLRSFHGFAAPTAPNLQAVDLDEVVRDVLFWTRKEAKSIDIDIETMIPVDLPPLTADPAQLKQVLLNLVVNALHAMPNGGRLIMSAVADGSRARIDIVDSGSGISADVLPRIFDPFFTTRPGGSGLGLAIIAKIVREHGAEIRVESETGHGTCITLYWPLQL
ncbi:MAG: HAMP domain-containing protein [Gammaproteobacteria bacterium]|nr:HAMP domain-containing protein [Rhodocyclaceae bacterium]MBU3909005.1 HAMP domain-containing protein [Gammaproteobacteria bacterium]MBU3989981.1 HAMP domain-containing protein [Gammaproteobacteria bacterium]MBU4003762.1 HAMP domain-containing protein [Gammaproteobacteria bacterium]MBU4021640.1 HAMP domain-containing protein [Gammaproteobacteria bacterium]